MLAPHKPGDSSPNPFGLVSRRQGLLASLPDVTTLPAWLSEEDLTLYAEAFRSSGFRGGLNYYRNLDRNWELQTSLAGQKINQPALYMFGERDPGIQMPGMADIIQNMPQLVPRLEAAVPIRGAGHWLPQERSQEVNAALIRFCSGWK